MPRAERSLRITDAYAFHVRQLQLTVARLVLDRWRAMDPTTLDQSFRSWLPATLELVTHGQREAVRFSSAYLAAFMSSELRRNVQPEGIDPEQYAGRTRDGRDLRLVFGLSLVSTKLALAQGHPVSTALDVGGARAVRAAGTEVMSAGRSSLADAMSSEERIIGYERVINSDNPCGACLGLADEGLRHTDQDLEIHANCSCSAEPVVADVPQNATRPTGSELFEAMDETQQDALFKERGGADKAELIRSGDATLSDLVSRHEAPQWGPTVYETPLEALVS